MADRMLRWFDYTHLSDNLQSVSKPFHDLAVGIVTEMPQTPERTVALRKLLEAKDAAVRCYVEGELTGQVTIGYVS